MELHAACSPLGSPEAPVAQLDDVGFRVQSEPGVVDLHRGCPRLAVAVGEQDRAEPLFRSLIFPVHPEHPAPAFRKSRLRQRNVIIPSIEDAEQPAVAQAADVGEGFVPARAGILTHVTEAIRRQRNGQARTAKPSAVPVR